MHFFIATHQKNIHIVCACGFGGVVYIPVSNFLFEFEFKCVKVQIYKQAAARRLCKIFIFTLAHKARVMHLRGWKSVRIAHARRGIMRNFAYFDGICKGCAPLTLSVIYYYITSTHMPRGLHNHNNNTTLYN